ncbi:hypothetical protein Riv7116_0366 [Rivularia sp. PCC 7116]|uniref:hypothetical protein n=1 Tax=Rivularia sp. PCC 7116 TaxID=373994 RepID=UPI00029F0331|nr:hypothetical protein [Rivularia sp. PCC 7116]AFY52970.1 hypothetical protein Riv7116_0366 [Rivularia sp. PCC 7116]
MSHKFSFLQVFAGNNFTFCRLLSIYTQKIQLKNNQADLRVSCLRRIRENKLLANCGKYVIPICQILNFNRMWCDIAVIVRKALGFRCYEPTTDIFQNLSNKSPLNFWCFQNRYLHKGIGFLSERRICLPRKQSLLAFSQE